jgi:predicted nucleic acid-binding protein
MKAAVLDTSVAVAWYLPEVFASAARVWQSELVSQQARLYVPSLHFWELGNVLRTYVLRRELDEATAREIWELHLEAPLELQEPPRERVLNIALEYGATVYDAVYIALALEIGVPLLTAERPSTPWLRKLGPAATSIVK